MKKQLDVQARMLSATSRALAEHLASLSSHCKIDWSDSWTDEELQSFRDASLRRISVEESEEAR